MRTKPKHVVSKLKPRLKPVAAAVAAVLVPLAPVVLVQARRSAGFRAIADRLVADHARKINN